MVLLMLLLSIPDEVVPWIGEDDDAFELELGLITEVESSVVVVGVVAERSGFDRLKKFRARLGWKAPAVKEEESADGGGGLLPVPGDDNGLFIVLPNALALILSVAS